MPLPDARCNNSFYKTGAYMNNTASYKSYHYDPTNNLICSYCSTRQSSQRQLSTFCHSQHYFCSLCLGSILQYKPADCPLCILVQASTPTTPMISDINACQQAFIATAPPNIAPATNGTTLSTNNKSSGEDYFYLGPRTYNPCPFTGPSSVYLPMTNMQQQQLQNPESYFITNNNQHIVPENFRYACVKLSNIPWDVSQSDVRNFFWNCQLPSVSSCIQSIHIMMDRNTGKTLSDAYVEFSSVSDMRKAMNTKNQRPLKGRIITVTESSQEEILKAIFPKWRGLFSGSIAIPPSEEVVRTMSKAAGGGTSACPPFITREEINSILVVCKNYKLHFSKKCAERPFENIISIIAKYPWHQAHLISNTHRDHVHEMLRLAIEALKTHISKDSLQMDPGLMERLTRAGIMCSAFTEDQKANILHTAQIDCPQDILHYMRMAVPNQFSITNKSEPTTMPRTLPSTKQPTAAVNNFFGATFPSTPQPLDYHHYKQSVIQQPKVPLQPYYQSTAPFYPSAPSNWASHNKHQVPSTHAEAFHTVAWHPNGTNNAELNSTEPSRRNDVSSINKEKGEAYDKDSEHRDAEGCNVDFEPGILPFSSLMIDIKKCSSYSADYNHFNDDRVVETKERLTQTDKSLTPIENNNTSNIDNSSSGGNNDVEPSESLSSVQSMDTINPFSSSIVSNQTAFTAKTVQRPNTNLSKMAHNVQGLPLLFAINPTTSPFSKMLTPFMSTSASDICHTGSSNIATYNNIWVMTPSYSKSTAAKN